jgi:hypothetical protein
MSDKKDYMGPVTIENPYGMYGTKEEAQAARNKIGMSLQDDQTEYTHNLTADGPDTCDGPESEGFAPGFEERSGQHIPGAKLDHDKMDMSLLEYLPNALAEIVHVMDYGQTKYSRGGFLEVEDAPRRYTSAMLRHWLKERFEKYDQGDPFYDTEKGLPFKGTVRHDAQVAVNAIFRLECILLEEQEEAMLDQFEDEYCAPNVDVLDKF